MDLKEALLRAVVVRLFVVFLDVKSLAKNVPKPEKKCTRTKFVPYGTKMLQNIFNNENCSICGLVRPSMKV